MSSITAIMPSRDGLVAEYLFSGNTQDTSGNGNHATNSGATLVADKYGRANEAYSFDGVDDLMTINHNANYDFGTNPYTIVIAFQTGDSLPVGTYALYSKYQNSANFVNVYWVSTTTFGIGVRNAGVDQIFQRNAASTVLPNTWYHLAITVDFINGNKLYYNAVSQTATTNTLTTNTSSNTGNILIARNVAAPNYTKCLIDSIELYNKALTPETILKNYNFWLSH